MIGMQNPAEPEAVEPRLAWEPEESPEVKESDEPPIDANDAEDSPLEPDDESLHGATVVGAAVGAAVSFALTTGGTYTGGAGVVFAALTAPAMPPPIAATPAAAPTPMATFCTKVNSFLATTTGAVTFGAQGSTRADAPTSKVKNTKLRNAICDAFFQAEQRANTLARFESA